MTLFEKILFLGRVNLFRALPVQDLGLVASVAEEQDVEAHRWLFHEGDVGDRMYLVIAGQVALSVQRPDGPQILASCGPGTFFGEMALLDDERRSASALCTEHCRFLVLDKDSFVQLVVDYPAISLVIFKYLCGLVRAGTSR